MTTPTRSSEWIPPYGAGPDGGATPATPPAPPGVIEGTTLPVGGIPAGALPPGALPPATPPPGASAGRSTDDVPAAGPGTHPTPRWARWALAGLLGVTAALYLWALDRNGWANSYYSAAAQAAGQSWKAWFFGSFDAANAITVDKPPASLWLMGLGVRLFGLSSWSILVPQVLLGVASVGVLYATVRRWFGAGAGLIAGAVLALTPVATLMFRFNNPDALLVFLLVCAAWAMGRATERGSLRWIVAAGAFVGFGFLAKMGQAFLVLPGFVAMYAIAAPVPGLRRVGHLLAAFAAMVVSAGWWVAVVELWPASSRPYIGGSQTNSALELILGYNGLGRLTGNETGSVVGGGQRGGAWGETGWDRLFTSSYGGQAAWLLPAALILIPVLLWASRHGRRTDLTRAAVIGWGGWLLVTAAVISYSQGIIHEYYTVALAPAIAALVGIGSMVLWRLRDRTWARVTAAAIVAVTTWTSWILLGRSADFVPWLRDVVLVVGALAAVGIAAAPLLPGRVGRRMALAAGAGALLVGLAGPAAYSVETAATTATGSLPSAGPTVAGSRGGPGGVGGHGQGGMPGGTRGSRGQAPGQGGQGGFGPGGTQPGGAQPGSPGTTTGQGTLPTPPSGSGDGTSAPGGTGNGFGGTTGPGGTTGGGTGTQGGPGVGGSLLNGSTPSTELTAALLADADRYTWVAATVGANSAAGYQLATQEPVLAIGGFNGSDPAPTLAQFQAMVDAGQIHYFIGGGGFGGQQGGSQAASEIAAWVQQTFTATTIGGTTVYDLTPSGSGTSGAATTGNLAT